MPKISFKHKIIMSFTVGLWAVWIAWAVIYTKTITENDKIQSLFGILATLMIVVYLGFFAGILYPDISYTSKKINENNRDKLYYIRRTTYCMLQMLYVFFLGGMSISIYYETWRIGFSVVVPIFLVCFAIVLTVYGMRAYKCLGIPPPADGEDEAPCADESADGGESLASAEDVSAASADSTEENGGEKADTDTDENKVEQEN